LVGAKTVGVAAASLQQRVEAAAREVGAKTLSSRVDPQSASAANGALAYVGEIELDAAVLQRLLYNIEAGTPFLEIDDLSIRPLRDAEAGERLRVSLAVTAYWRPSP
jgi:general secretion pathway protein M